MTTLQFKKDKDGKLFLTTRREGKEQDKFELIEIGRSIMFSGQESNFIKLVRVRKTSR